MLSWWTTTSLYSITIKDTDTNGVPLCSVYSTIFYESNLTLLAPFPTEMAYLSMLFIFQMVCTARVYSNKQSPAGTMLAM